MEEWDGLRRCYNWLITQKVKSVIKRHAQELLGGCSSTPYHEFKRNKVLTATSLKEIDEHFGRYSVHVINRSFLQCTVITIGKLQWLIFCDPCTIRNCVLDTRLYDLLILEKWLDIKVWMITTNIAAAHIILTKLVSFLTVVSAEECKIKINLKCIVMYIYFSVFKCSFRLKFLCYL